MARQRRKEETTRPEIWAVGGGKGGIGKSFLTANLGMGLASRGFRTLLVDFDFGGANLHTWLGVTNTHLTLSDFLTDKVANLDDLVMDTGIPNVRLLNGANDTLGIANLKHWQKNRLLKAIQRARYDYVLIDLGGGTHYNTIDFFLAADQGFIVVSPEPVAVENAYRFVKAAFYRRIRNVAQDLMIRDLITELMERNLGKEVRTPYELIKRIEALYHEQLPAEAANAKSLLEAIHSFAPRIILNQMREEKDEEVGRVMGSACRRFFGIDAQFSGEISYHEDVWRSIRARKPFLTNNDDSPVKDQILKIIHEMVPAERASAYKAGEGLSYESNAQRLL